MLHQERFKLHIFAYRKNVLMKSGQALAQAGQGNV